MIPHYFAMDEQAARDFVFSQAAGTLVTTREDGSFDSTFLPLMWEGDRIRMHMGRANDQWRHGDFPRPAIIVCTGPHGYVSAADYDIPEGMSIASTWDYTQVTLHGRLEVSDDAQAARCAAVDLSYMHEREVAEKLSDDYLAKASKAIIAVTFTVERIEGIAKLSQNKLPHEREKIVDRLRARGCPESSALADDIEAAPSKARRVPYLGPLKSAH